MATSYTAVFVDENGETRIAGTLTFTAGEPTFNGGTITGATTFAAPVTIAPTDPTDISLLLSPAAGATAAFTDQIRVLKDTGSQLGGWDAAGELYNTTPAGISSSLQGSDGTLFFVKNGFVAADLAAGAVLRVRDRNSAIIFQLPETGGVRSAPPVSSAPTLALGTAYQNTLGYDVLLCIYLSVTVNTSGVLKLGVGPTNTPTQQTLVTGITSTGLWPVPIYLPASYYALLSVTGTITVAVDGQIAMPV